MNILTHAWRLVRREPRRAAASALGVTIASALLMSIVLFGAASGTTVSRRALAALPMDAQAILAPGFDAGAAASLVTADPAVSTSAPLDLVHFDAATRTTATAATQASAGVLVGIDPGFTDTTGLFRLSAGSVKAGEITVSRDLATNLGLVPGDRATFSLPGGGRADFVVSGVVDITGADLLLGPIDAAHRAVAANAPTNVAVTDRQTLATVAAGIPAGAVATDPASSATAPTAGSGTTSPVLAAEPAVLREILLRYDHAQLPGNPTDAQRWLDLVRRRIERAAAGSVTVVDDASATLEPVAKDLAWGQVLFIFLGLPGIVLALALSRFATDASADATRRHAALLRARGATRSQILATFLGSAALTSFLGAIVGATAGVVLSLLVFGPELLAADPITTIASAGLVTIIASATLSTIAASLPLRDQLQGELAGGRHELLRTRPVLWARLYLDVIALVAAAVIFLTIGGKTQPVLTTEGNPTVSLAITSFVAPLLFWVGGTLVLVRLVDRAMRRGLRPTWILQRLLGPGGLLAARSVSARARAATRAIVLLALALSFATSVLTFDATYRQQQRVDAALTLGADLKAVPTVVGDASAAGAVAGPGVAAVTPFVDRVVYVGSEAQDLLAIDATSLAATAPLSDSFFQGTSASAAMAMLAGQPDAIFVSAETATDYSIVPGDRIRIRVPDVNGNLREVDFRMAGIALEFPTAPKDAFLVANLDYVARQTGNSQISFVLARADGATTGRDLAQRLGPDWTVTDLHAVNVRLANSVTSVDLSALVALDLGFAILIASVGVALFLLAGLSERRQELATLTAIGAEPSQLRAAITGETGIVGIAGLAIGIPTGAIVGATLLAILAGVFDPPADVPVFPIVGIGLVAASAAVGLLGASVVGGRAVGRIDVMRGLRER